MVENVAVVASAVAALNVTVPGPLSVLHATVRFAGAGRPGIAIGGASAVPEPGTLSLIGLASLAGLAFRKMRVG